MKAAVVEKPHHLVIKEVETPRPGPEEVLVRVVGCAVCATDVHSFEGEDPNRPVPAILGHEFSGPVVEVGERVTRLAPGDRVAVLPLVTCGHCPMCRSGQSQQCDNRINMGSQRWPGGFAEYVRVPESLAFKLPEGLSYDAGAMVEPLAVGVHAVRQAGVQLGDSVLVVGSGAIGLMCVLVARAAGANQIIATDVRDFNLRRARELGATHTADARSEDVVALARQLTGGRGVHRTLLAVDAPGVLEQAIGATRKRGTVVLIGMFRKPLTIDLWLARRAEQLFTGTLSYNGGDFETAVALGDAHRGELESLVTHHFQLEELARALELAQTRSEDWIRIMVHP